MEGAIMHLTESLNKKKGEAAIDKIILTIHGP